MTYATIYIHSLASYEDRIMLKSVTHMEMLLFNAISKITVPYISLLATYCKGKKKSYSTQMKTEMY